MGFGGVEPNDSKVRNVQYAVVVISQSLVPTSSTHEANKIKKTLTRHIFQPALEFGE